MISARSKDRGQQKPAAAMSVWKWLGLQRLAWLFILCFGFAAVSWLNATGLLWLVISLFNGHMPAFTVVRVAQHQPGHTADELQVMQYDELVTVLAAQLGISVVLCGVTATLLVTTIVMVVLYVTDWNCERNPTPPLQVMPLTAAGQAPHSNAEAERQKMTHTASESQNSPLVVPEQAKIQDIDAEYWRPQGEPSNKLTKVSNKNELQVFTNFIDEALNKNSLLVGGLHPKCKMTLYSYEQHDTKKKSDGGKQLAAASCPRWLRRAAGKSMRIDLQGFSAEEGGLRYANIQLQLGNKSYAMVQVAVNTKSGQCCSGRMIAEALQTSLNKQTSEIIKPRLTNRSSGAALNEPQTIQPKEKKHQKQKQKKGSSQPQNTEKKKPKKPR